MQTAGSLKESPSMTEDDGKPKPKWQMKLFGIPCEHCWTPAEALVVFDHGRLVIHVDRAIKPCVGANPPPPAPQPTVVPKRKAPTVKRRVGRPVQRSTTHGG